MSRKISETMFKANKIMVNKKEKEDRYLDKMRSQTEKQQKQLDFTLKNFEERKRFINTKLSQQETTLSMKKQRV